ncbi:Selenoprotein F [Manis javanica]|nr:Selenoprotein F [Manis javanica]
MVAMAAKPGRWRLRQALGLRLLLTTVLQAVSALGADSICFSWIPTVEDAVRKKHNLKPKSCMQVLFSKSVDENWEGSLKSKLSSGVINPNSSEDYRSSMFVVQTLYSSFWMTVGTLLRN